MIYWSNQAAFLKLLHEYAHKQLLYLFIHVYLLYDLLKRKINPKIQLPTATVIEIYSQYGKFGVKQLSFPFSKIFPKFILDLTAVGIKWQLISQ